MVLRILPWVAVAAAVGFAAAGLGHAGLPVPDLAAAVGRVAPVAVSGAATAGTDASAVAAVRDAVTRSNTAQAKAFASGDDTLMRVAATPSFYDEMVRTNADLRAAGIASIELAGLRFESVAVTGDTATATTVEIWRSTYADGSRIENTDRNVYTLVRQGAAWVVDTDQHPQSAVTAPTAPGRPVVPVPVASDASTSSNWSGYAASGGTYTAVSGTWVVPSVSATSPGADATWVGIGGLGSRDLIQAGTQATVSGGSVEYTAWTEQLPASSQTVPLTVRAGDTVTVAITERSSGLWDIVIRNDTNGDRYATTVRYTSMNSSAEWIQEVPAVGRGLLPLDDFGTVRFTSATAVRDGVTVDLRSSAARGITMINGAGQALAQPSAIGVDGRSFSVARTGAASSGGIPQGRRRRG